MHTFVCTLCIPCTLLYAYCAYLAHFFDWSALVCSKYVSCAQSAQSTFKIRAKCAEFAHCVLIAGKSTSPQRKCTPCAHSTYFVLTYQIHCAYHAYFGYSRARSTLMDACWHSAGSCCLTQCLCLWQGQNGTTSAPDRSLLLHGEKKRADLARRRVIWLVHCSYASGGGQRTLER